jgi:hypothetical protein
MSSNTGNSQYVVKDSGSTCPPGSSKVDSAHIERLKEFFPSLTGCSINPDQSPEFEFKEGARVRRPSESGMPAGYVKPKDLIGCFPNGSVGTDQVVNYNEQTFADNELGESTFLHRDKRGEVSVFKKVKAWSQSVVDGTNVQNSLLCSDPTGTLETKIMVGELEQLLRPKGNRPFFVGAADAVTVEKA